MSSYNNNEFNNEDDYEDDYDDINSNNENNNNNENDDDNDDDASLPNYDQVLSPGGAIMFNKLNQNDNHDDNNDDTNDVENFFDGTSITNYYKLLKSKYNTNANIRYT